MRLTFTVLFCFFAIAVSWAQPSNDDCISPISLSLGAPSPCPNSNAAVNNFSFNNNGATPVSPYPSLNSCQGDGTLDGPAAEVWFTFTATGHETTFDISGLNTPNVILFTGVDCQFLQAIDCASANNNAGNLDVTFNTLVGQNYYIMVSGGDVDDQGFFSMEVTSELSCEACLTSTALQATPPPQNGTYSSGQDITFCFNINQWDITSTVEWLHAVTVDFGPGWDLSTLVPMPPPSCGGDGSWDWYNNWTSCNSGLNFGPGFAYDSSSGVGCGGTANDGDPGNNWGDGNGGCSSITPANPVQFCWSIRVNDCPPNLTGNDLTIEVQAWSDGDSGSWTQLGCNSGVTFDALASTICCDDLDPLVSFTDPSCPGLNDGTVSMQGSGGLEPSTIYNFTLLDASGAPVFQCNQCSGEVIATNLPPGLYAVNVQNVAENCVRSTTVTLSEGQAPQVSIIPGTVACEGDPIDLTANVAPPHDGQPNTTYTWTGPGPNPIPNAQTVSVTTPGIYEVVVNVNGCLSDPVTYDFQPVAPTVTIASLSTIGCQDDIINLAASGAVSYQWTDLSTNLVVGNGSTYDHTMVNSTTIQVEGTDANGCTATETIDLTLAPDPTLSGNITGDLCAGELLTFDVSGADIYTWLDNGSTAVPRLESFEAGTYSLTVTGTELGQNCSSNFVFDFTVAELPEVTIADVDPICAGETVTLVAIGGANVNGFMWSTGVNSQAIDVSPTVTTTYTVTAVDFDGCESTAEVTVEVSEPLQAPVVTCGENSPSSVTFEWGAITGATGYDVTVLTGQMGVLDGTSYTVSGLTPNETVTITVEALGAGTCGGTASVAVSCLSQDCIPVGLDIVDVDDMCLGETIIQEITLEAVYIGATGGDTLWSGPGIINPFLGVFDPNVAGVGTHDIVLSYTEGDCIFRDTMDVTIFDTPTSSFAVSENVICSTDTLTVVYTGNATNTANFTWDLDGGNIIDNFAVDSFTVAWPMPGDYTISLEVEQAGCSSSTTTQMVSVETPLSPPIIQCADATTTSVMFEWNNVVGAVDYQVTVVTGQAGVLLGTTYTVDGIAPDEEVTIIVEAISNGACSNSMTQMSCNAASCPDFGFSFENIPPICLVENMPLDTLSVEVTGGEGTGSIIWSGAGVIDAFNGVFDANTAGAGMHTITATYTEGPCVESEDIIIEILPTPTANFTAMPDTLCINQETMLTYTGTATANATYNWTFGGGTANPGTGQGPQMVSWPTAGEQTVALVVEEDGCTSEQFSTPIVVESPLDVPLINCNTTSTSIEFSWEPIDGAIEYVVTDVSGPAGVLSGTTYTVSGLTPLQEVTIIVEAVGDGPCGNSMSEQTCVAEDCPDVLIDIDAVDDICLADVNVSVALNATITGATMAGTSTWTGMGILDENTGTFDPQLAGVGTHTIVFTYVEGNCSYNAQTTITVHATPTANFSLDQLVCIDQISNIIYTGTATENATYNWDLDGGNIIAGSGQGPLEVSWATSGTKTVVLTVEENGCLSEEFSVEVEVTDPIQAPVVSCEGTNTTVTFTWEQVMGATAYEVTGAMGTLTGTTYEIVDLMPGQEVTITVTAVTDNPCGNVSTVASCIALACDDVALQVQAPEAVCEASGIVTLTSNPIGGLGGGNSSWAGDGITDAIGGTFDPAGLSGIVDITYTYEEGLCSYDTTFQIRIDQEPTGEITTDAVTCTTENVIITFTGETGDANPVFTWNTDGGNIVQNNGLSVEVNWDTPGEKNISLTVNNGTCTNQFETTITVDQVPDAPVVDCIFSSTESVTFQWADVPNALTYDVVVSSGQMGTLTGTTYTVTDLMPGEEVTIEVIAIGNPDCGQNSTTASCSATECPEVVVDVTGIETLCQGDESIVTISFTGDADQVYDVEYSINGVINTAAWSNGEELTLSNNIQTGTTIEIISFSNPDLAGCIYDNGATFTVAVSTPLVAGTALPSIAVCASDEEVIDLTSLVVGNDAGGTWTEESSSTGGAFNAAAATFNTSGQAPGVYQFTYTVTPDAPCPSDEVTVEIEILPNPVADAGDDQTIFCNMGMVSLGGSNSSQGTGISYNWGIPDGAIVPNPSSQYIETSAAGTYVFTVTNEAGCSAQDEVEVIADNDVPVPMINLSEISCFESEDGAIIIEGVTGGTPPYTYALNDGEFTDQTFYGNLTPGEYSLVVQDANNCSAEVIVNITQPDELVVQLIADFDNEDNIMNYGDSIQLSLNFNASAEIDTIIWTPAELFDGQEGSPANPYVSPEETTMFSVTIVDVQGCTASDDITIFVQKDRDVFVPNVFSPNDDGINDILYIQTGSNNIANVRAFQIFNRWGESVFSAHDFLPNSPQHGWDGKFRGEFMNPAVFVYKIEVEFNDGEVRILSGDVTLVR